MRIIPFPKTTSTGFAVDIPFAPSVCHVPCTSETQNVACQPDSVYQTISRQYVMTALPPLTWPNELLSQRPRWLLSCLQSFPAAVAACSTLPAALRGRRLTHDVNPVVNPRTGAPWLPSKTIERRLLQHTDPLFVHFLPIGGHSPEPCRKLISSEELSFHCLLSLSSPRPYGRGYG